MNEMRVPGTEQEDHQNYLCPPECLITAYLWASHHRKQIDLVTGQSDKPLSVALADALQRERAARLKAEWTAKHYQELAAENSPARYRNPKQLSWTEADWMELADKQLRGEVMSGGS